MTRWPSLPPGLAPTLAAAVLWGTSFPVNRAGLEALDAPTFAAVRFGLAGLAAAGFAWVLREAAFAPYLAPRTWAFGALNALAFSLQYEGQARTTAGKSALLVNVSVVFVGILSYVLYRERFSGRKVAAVGLGLAGAFLVATEGDLAALRGGEAVGDLLVLLAGLSWSVYLVLNKDAVSSGRGIMNLTAALLSATAVLLVPRMLVAGDPAGLLVPHAWIAPAYTGVACSALAFYAWSRGLVALTPTVSAVTLLFEVVVALALSVAFLHEAFTLPMAVGAAGIVAAVVLASGAEGSGSARERPAEDEPREADEEQEHDEVRGHAPADDL